MNRGKTVILACALLACNFGGFAMIQMMALPELVKHAQIVAIVRIGPAVPMPKPEGSTIPWLSHELVVEKVLKGQDLIQGSIQMPLPNWDEGKYWEEDSVVLPPQGERAVVFLSRDAANKQWRSVNEIQGVWPLTSGTDTPVGAGTGQTLADVEKAVNRKE